MIATKWTTLMPTMYSHPPRVRTIIIGQRNVANGLVEYDGFDEEAHVVGGDEERGGIGGSFVEQEMQRDLFLRASFFISVVDLISQNIQILSVIAA
jgi:hypothetical protein